MMVLHIGQDELSRAGTGLISFTFTLACRPWCISAAAAPALISEVPCRPLVGNPGPCRCNLQCYDTYSKDMHGYLQVQVEEPMAG